MFKNVQVGHEMSEMSTLSIKSKLNRRDALRENGHWGKSKGDLQLVVVHHHGVHFGEGGVEIGEIRSSNTELRDLLCGAVRDARWCTSGSRWGTRGP